MKRITYDDNGLRLDPRGVREVADKRINRKDFWWYEERDGITLHCDSTRYADGFIPIKQLREWLRIAESTK